MPRSISPAELAARLEEPALIQLLDVRNPAETALATLANSQHIPLHELPRRWNEVKRSAGSTLVCYCHHGVRSWNAAAFLEAQGFTDVYSLTGGIDAWSCEIDPRLPRYA